MNLIIFKITSAFLLAILLTYIAERKSIKWAGILSAFPNISLLTMLFIGLEQGITFTTKASLYGIYAIMCDIILVSVIMLSTFYLKSVSFLLGIISFFLLGFVIIGFFPRNVFIAIILFFLYWLLFLFLWRKIPKVKVHTPIKSKKELFLLQFLIISTVIITATFLAPIVKEEWAGIISAFPALSISIGFILLTKYGSNELRTFFKSAILGWLPTAAYMFSLIFTYSRFGILFGTLVSVLIAVVIVVILDKIKEMKFVKRLNY